ncbi:MAG: Stk1 family PASTA domain-containing Ser/Thr kinase [bacterium]
MDPSTQPLPTPSPGGSADALIGTLVDGRYQVLRRLARGGMATVYEALDTRLDRTVALKVMNPALAEDPEFVSRFRREARAAAQLAHPHVVAVYDQGETDGVPYLAMEYVPGRTLRDVLREHGPLTPEQALTVLDPVLEALAAAHDAGFVHRDVKPENILISDDGRVKVTDFGLARAVTNVTSATQGMLIGTVAYLSPEHVERGVADGRSDVYGAGICLFEMATGQVPFAAENPLSVAYQHVNSDVPSPSSLRPGTPPDVDALVARATRRDPDLRYPDARSFLADVRRVRRELPPPRPLTTGPTDTLVVPAGLLPAQPVKAAPPPAAAQARPPAHRAAPRQRGRGRGWAIAIVLLLLVVAGAAAAGWYLAAGPGKTVVVPGILGLDRATAEAELAAADLNLTVSSEEYSETVKKGLIISSDPEPGSDASAGSAVAVVLSLGPERYDVPALIGLTVDEASAALASANLALGSVSEEYDPVAPLGQVIATDPPVGDSVKSGTPVNLVVSRGPKPVKIPDLAGTPLDDATAQLEDAGLLVTVTEEFSSDYSFGNVISTTPSAGEKVDVGGTVTLVVSKGPPPVPVPDVVGMSRDDAVIVLENAGFVVAVNEPPVTPLNEVVLQDPGGGTELPYGSTVTITVI